MDLNNRQTGKHGTKPRALELLGHSVIQYTNPFWLNWVFNCGNSI